MSSSRSISRSRSKGASMRSPDGDPRRDMAAPNPSRGRGDVGRRAVGISTLGPVECSGAGDERKRTSPSVWPPPTERSSGRSRRRTERDARPHRGDGPARRAIFDRRPRTNSGRRSPSFATRLETALIQPRARPTSTRRRSAAPISEIGRLTAITESLLRSARGESAEPPMTIDLRSARRGSRRALGGAGSWTPGACGLEESIASATRRPSFPTRRGSCSTTCSITPFGYAPALDPKVTILLQEDRGRGRGSR